MAENDSATPSAPGAQPSGLRRALGTWAQKLRLDWFIGAILAAVVIALFLPARGAAATGLHWTTTIGIGLLFFLYGARMSPRETLAGLRHWRLQLAVAGITFGLFPVIGLLSHYAFVPLLGPGLAAGMLFVTLVPSTVQSSITFVSIARGNISGAIVSASMSNLLGVFLTPLLVAALMTTTSGVHVDGSSFLKICAQLLLPFFLGQALRHWVWPLIKAAGPKLGLFDKAIIVVIVYAAFSEAVAGGLLHEVSAAQLAMVVAGCAVLLALVLGITGMIGRLAGFSVADQRVIQFCGSKKSLATGLPMAAVLFAGQPIGLLVLPLMVFHQIQLIVCSWMATNYGRHYDEDHSSAG